MKSIHLDDDIVARLQNVFRNLSYKFVWKWEEEVMTGKPDNVYVSKWISQTTLLGMDCTSQSALKYCPSKIDLNECIHLKLA